MKKILLSAFILISVASFGQQVKLSCDVLKSDSTTTFAGLLSQKLPDYKFAKQDNVGRQIVRFYTDNNSNELQVWYNLRDGKYVVSRVVCQQPNVQAVYSLVMDGQYEARERNTWHVDCCGHQTMIRVYPLETKGYYNIEFSI